MCTMSTAQAVSPCNNATLWGSAAAWGSLLSMNFGAGLAKHLFPVIGAYGITSLRITLAAIILCLVIRPWKRTGVRQLSPALLGYGAVLGLMNLLFYQAIARIPIGIAIGIEVIGPLAVVVMGSRSRRDFLWLAAAAAGLFLLLPLRADSALDPVGIAFAVGAAACWAAYILCGKQVSATLGRDAVAWGMVIAALITLPVGLAASGTQLFTPWALGVGIGIAILSSVLPYTLEMAALRRLPAHVFGILLSASPAVGALVGYVVLGERLTPLQWLAILCIIFAACGSAISASLPRRTPGDLPI